MVNKNNFKPVKLIGMYLLVLVFTSFCADKRNCYILESKDFSAGDWLLVKQNIFLNSIYVIDDERILSKYANKVMVKGIEEHRATTPDGDFKLFKNGELVGRYAWQGLSCLNSEANGLMVCG